MEQLSDWVIQNTITKVLSNGMEKTCCYAGAKKVTTGIFFMPQ